MSAIQTTRRRIALVAAATTISACGNVTDEATTQELSNAVVYDEDDRVEAADAPVAWAALGSASSLALIPGKRLVSTGSTMHVDALTLQQAERTCADEPFAQQPTASECSAVLIDDDLVLTAGHCFPEGESCDRYAYVFDYAFQGGVEIPSDSVYGCRGLVNVRHDGVDGPLDFAIVQLDRATGRKPADLSTRLPGAGDSLVTMGHPSGLPLKIDVGAVLIRSDFPTAEQFTASIDAFRGNSGGPVFDSHYGLLGILIAGAPGDYEMSLGCGRARRVDLFPDGGERILRFGPLIAALCESNYPSPRLCAREPSCGDGVCSPNESHSDCDVDCPAALCTGADCTAFPEPPWSLSIPTAAAEPADGTPVRAAAGGCSLRYPAEGFSPGVLTALCAVIASRARRRAAFLRAS